MTLSITTHSVTTFCGYAKCSVLFVMQNVAMLSVSMRNIIMLSVIMQNVVILRAVVPKRYNKEVG